eukprot:gene4963-3561_t
MSSLTLSSGFFATVVFSRASTTALFVAVCQMKAPLLEGPFSEVDPNTRGASQGTKNVEPITEALFRPEDLMSQLGVDGSYYVLGIDEAGRGPVIGPMVYTGAAVALKEHQALVQCGVADSKQIDEAHRDASLEKMRQNLKTFVDFTHLVTPAAIAADMLGTKGRTLNTLSHDVAMRIISQATLQLRGKLCAVFVDTVGSPEAYAAKLRGRFPHLHVVVRSKADSLFPVVSAASIVAKTTRDAAVRDINTEIHERLRGCTGGADADRVPEYVGCGYPSDPRAMEYVRGRLHRFFVHSRDDDFIRPSWGPVLAIAGNPDLCVPVLFEEDARRITEMKQLEKLAVFQFRETAAVSGSPKRQKRLSFKKPPPSRHALFAALHMKSYVPALREGPEATLYASCYIDYIELPGSVATDVPQFRPRAEPERLSHSLPSSPALESLKGSGGGSISEDRGHAQRGVVNCGLGRGVSRDRERKKNKKQQKNWIRTNDMIWTCLSWRRLLDVAILTTAVRMAMAVGIAALQGQDGDVELGPEPIYRVAAAWWRATASFTIAAPLNNGLPAALAHVLQNPGHSAGHWHEALWLAQRPALDARPAAPWYVPYLPVWLLRRTDGTIGLPPATLLLCAFDGMTAALLALLLPQRGAVLPFPGVDLLWWFFLAHPVMAALPACESLICLEMALLTASLYCSRRCAEALLRGGTRTAAALALLLGSILSLCLGTQYVAVPLAQLTSVALHAAGTWAVRRPSGNRKPGAAVVPRRAYALLLAIVLTGLASAGAAVRASSVRTERSTLDHHPPSLSPAWYARAALPYAEYRRLLDMLLLLLPVWLSLSAALLLGVRAAEECLVPAHMPVASHHLLIWLPQLAAVLCVAFQPHLTVPHLILAFLLMTSGQAGGAPQSTRSTERRPFRSGHVALALFFFATQLVTGCLAFSMLHGWLHHAFYMSSQVVVLEVLCAAATAGYVITWVWVCLCSPCSSVAQNQGKGEEKGDAAMSAIQCGNLALFSHLFSLDYNYNNVSRDKYITIYFKELLSSILEFDIGSRIRGFFVISCFSSVQLAHGRFTFLLSKDSLCLVAQRWGSISTLIAVWKATTEVLDHACWNRTREELSCTVAAGGDTLARWAEEQGRGNCCGLHLFSVVASELIITHFEAFSVSSVERRRPHLSTVVPCAVQDSITNISTLVVASLAASSLQRTSRTKYTNNINYNKKQMPPEEPSNSLFSSNQPHHPAPDKTHSTTAAKMIIYTYDAPAGTRTAGLSRRTLATALLLGILGVWLLSSGLVSGGLPLHTAQMNPRTRTSLELYDLSTTTTLGVGKCARRMHLPDPLSYFTHPTGTSAANATPPRDPRGAMSAGRRPRGPPVTSLRDACPQEIQTHCAESKNQLRCLLEVKDGGALLPFMRHDTSERATAAEFSAGCMQWLGAREACIRFLQHHAVLADGAAGREAQGFSCPLSLPARDCLRRAPVELLPAACRDSDYYRAAMQAGYLEAKGSRMKNIYHP